MHILAVLPPDRWMEINLIDPLRQHYCETLHIFHYPGGMGQLGSADWRRNREKLNQELLSTARTLRTTGRLDLIFFVVYDDFLLVETARQLQQLNIPMVNYHVDMAFQWYRVIRTAPYFDVLAVAQMTNADHLKPYAQHIHWMPMAANPRYYFRDRHHPAAYQHTVSFVGSFNPYRRALLSDCVNHGIAPVIYGRGWTSAAPSPYTFSWDAYKVCHDLRYYALPRWNAEGIESVLGPIRRKHARQSSFEPMKGADLRGPCEEQTLPSIFAESQVNLGFSDTGWHSGTEIQKSHNLQCRLRDFEVPMAGGFYLVQEAPDHAEYFHIGEEIVTWRESGELIEKARYYMRHSNVTDRIRRAGQRRVLEHHTWQHRFDALFAQIES